jgi:uncharacterized membrane protein (DUF373 family)
MEVDRSSTTRLFRETRDHWPLMTAYERFEQVVALVLSFVIAVVIVLALVQIVLHVLPPLIVGGVDVLDHGMFQALFGTIMTLLIAMEFKHSIIRAGLRQASVVQAKTVILIALLALSRKFIILDTAATDAASIAALAGATLVLGIVYWLLRERDDWPGIATPPRIQTTAGIGKIPAPGG